ncbi:hypothetical protein BDV38DRAFT_261115, partial [Aspergillus pseudotamarii]
VRLLVDWGLGRVITKVFSTLMLASNYVITLILAERFYLVNLDFNEVRPQCSS